MGTSPNPTPATLDAMQKAAVLQAISQLDLLVEMFQAAPDKVRKSAKDFKESLQEWVNA